MEAQGGKKTAKREAHCREILTTRGKYHTGEKKKKAEKEKEREEKEEKKRKGEIQSIKNNKK